MGKKSKYAGGSREISFRLPADKFDQAKQGIEEYLKQFEPGYVEPLPKDLQWFSDLLIKNGTAIDLESEIKLMYGKGRTPEDLENYKGRLESTGSADPLTQFIEGVSNNSMEPYVLPTQEEHDAKRLEALPLIDELSKCPPEWATKYKQVIKNGKKSIPTEFVIEKLPPGKLDKFLAEPNPPASSGTVYNCGCMRVNSLFKRNPKCKVDIKDHLI